MAFSAGQVLRAADLNSLSITEAFLTGDLAMGGDATIGGNLSVTGIGGVTTIVKPSDETVNNSATFQSDDFLSAALAANATYTFELLVYFNSNSTAGFKEQFNLPSGATIPKSAFFTTTPSFGTANAAGQVVAITGNSTDLPFMLKGVIVTTTASGTANWQWAQNTANASNTIVRADSYLTYRRVA